MTDGATLPPPEGWPIIQWGREYAERGEGGDMDVVGARLPLAAANEAEAARRDVRDEGRRGGTDAGEREWGKAGESPSPVCGVRPGSLLATNSKSERARLAPPSALARARLFVSTGEGGGMGEGRGKGEGRGRRGAGKVAAV